MTIHESSDDAAVQPESSADELRLLMALRNGDEAAFVTLVERYQATMLRIAMMYVSSRSVAEEVVQDTWLGVLQGLARFEGRSSLKTWIFRILTNRAKTRGEREGRVVPLAALWTAEADTSEPTVDPDRFYPPDHAQWANGWVSYPRAWQQVPEDRALSRELRDQIEQAIEMLPDSQRTVITLRDVEGLPAEDVCNILELSETNQRVLLHRARARVRRALEQYMNVTQGTTHAA